MGLKNSLFADLEFLTPYFQFKYYTDSFFGRRFNDNDTKDARPHQSVCALQSLKRTLTCEVILSVDDEGAIVVVITWCVKPTCLSQ